MLINSNEIKNVTVLGLGISGKAAVELAVRQGFSVTAVDERDIDDCFSDLPHTDRERLTLHTGFQESILPDSDLIIISPGISGDSKLGRLASESGVPVISELDFASRFAHSPIVAITGTNGKTTVTEMTEMILDNAISAGNIGHPLSRAVEDSSKECLVVECSSFQLERAPLFSPLSAVILNISSDHMDRYANFADYTHAKFNIFRNIADSANMIINFNLLGEWREWVERENLSHSKPPVTFSAETEEADIYREGSIVCFDSLGIGKIDISSSAISGKHNIENFMAAVALASRVASGEELINGVERLLENFRISPHRQELVAIKNGITYVNDSKATNPDALIAALKAFGKSRNICLIAGGLNKEMDFTPVKKESQKIKTALLIGESKELLKKCWAPGIKCEICDSLEDALSKADKTASKGDIILLSPGCASMDMFENYKERGKKFCEIIRQSGN